MSESDHHQTRVYSNYCCRVYSTELTLMDIAYTTTLAPSPHAYIYIIPHALYASHHYTLAGLISLFLAFFHFETIYLMAPEVDAVHTSVAPTEEAVSQRHVLTQLHRCLIIPLPHHILHH